jgi:hypothetical protein
LIEQGIYKVGRPLYGLAHKQELYFDRNNYHALRCRVRQFDQNRKNIEIERRKQEQTLETYYIVYPFKRRLLKQFRSDFQRLWLRCCNYDNESYLKQFNIKLIRRPNYPSKIK